MKELSPAILKSFFYQFIVGLTVSIILLGVLIGTKFIKISRATVSQNVLVEPVTVSVAEKQSWPVTFSTVGSLNSVKGIILVAQESGIVTELNFVSGQRVEQGALLVSLDTNIERAELAAAQASAVLATANLQRIIALKSVHANSKAEYETVNAEANKSQAEVDKILAKIARKELRAPFSGYLGISDVKMGQFVAIGTEIVSLDSYEELFLDFAFPQNLVEDMSVHSNLKFDVDGILSKEFTASIVAIDNQFDLKTGQVKVRALVKNLEKNLRSGMYARIKAESRHSEDVIVIPSSSVNFAPYGNSVFVVEKKVGNGKDDGDKDTFVLRQQVVQLGRRRGDFIAVISGLTEGSQVVNSGTFKLRSGSLVKIISEPALKNEYDPSPVNS